MTLHAFNGPVAALDARGDTLVAGGYSTLHGSTRLGNSIKVFDLRMGMRPAADAPFVPVRSILVHKNAHRLFLWSLE